MMLRDSPMNWIPAHGPTLGELIFEQAFGLEENQIQKLACRTFVEFLIVRGRGG